MKVRLASLKDTQPRREHGDIAGLKASISEVGLIHPPTVDENFNGMVAVARARLQEAQQTGAKSSEVSA